MELNCALQKRELSIEPCERHTVSDSVQSRNWDRFPGRPSLPKFIGQYSLDPTLVKAYAAAFCGTPTLKEASRELVESFISHLATSAKENRDGLQCKLNSYAQPEEVKL